MSDNNLDLTWSVSYVEFIARIRDLAKNIKDHDPIEEDINIYLDNVDELVNTILEPQCV